MAVLPPGTWEVCILEDIKKMEGSVQTNSNYDLQVLLAIPPDDGREGLNKFMMSGREHLMMMVPVVIILRDDRFKGLAIHTQLQLNTQVTLMNVSNYIENLISGHRIFRCKD